jgi:hypothetical protein
MRLIRSHAEDEVLYRRLKASRHEASRKFGQEREPEHQLVEQQLQKTPRFARRIAGCPSGLY